MGHTFGESMRCGTCHVSYAEHQARPEECAMAHKFNRKEHCKNCGVHRKQHQRNPAPCRYKGKS